MYLTPNPRWKAQYVGRRERGKAVRRPIVVETSALWQRADVGMLLTPAGGGNQAGRLERWPCLWAADTGCFTRPIALDDYLSWLDTHRPYQHRCLWATAPDVVGDAVATWTLSAPALPAIRALGYRAALVAQDGLERLPVEWNAFDCLFLGGTTGWKLGEASYALSQEARRRRKWVHMGRVNSQRRLVQAQIWGCDSADGTSLAFNPPAYIRDIPRWLDRVHRQPLLWQDSATAQQQAQEPTP